MYIDPIVIFIVLALVGLVALIYLIFTLNNINKLVKNANTILITNSANINESLLKLPGVIDNFNDVSESMKDVTDAVTDLTADVIVAKENVKSNIDVVVEIVNILKSVFIR